MLYTYEVLYELPDQPTMYRVIVKAHNRREAASMVAPSFAGAFVTEVDAK